MTQTLLEEPPALRQALQNKRIQQQQKILFYTLRQHVPIYMKMNLKKKVCRKKNRYRCNSDLSQNGLPFTEKTKADIFRNNLRY